MEDKTIVEVLRFEIAKLELKMRDILVLRYIGEIPSQQELEELASVLYGVLPNGTRALLIGRDDIELSVISKEDNV